MRPKRKPIPKWVKDTVLFRQNDICAQCGEALEGPVEYDHRPPILMRPVNHDASDYVPLQNDPAFIFALHKACHLLRTVGRIPGASRTVTTRGSDVWLKAKFARLEGKTKPKKKRKILSRGFNKSGGVRRGKPRRGTAR